MKDFDKRVSSSIFWRVVTPKAVKWYVKLRSLGWGGVNDPYGRDGLHKNGYRLIHWAAANTIYPYVIKVLFEAGADVNVRDNDGRTPLDWAIEFNKNPEVILILEEEVDRVLNATGA